ncbi:MAG: hypothetical protein AAF849_17420 [Bacteroidota bacterium]
MKTHVQRLDVIIAFIIFLGCCLVSFVSDNEETVEALFTLAGN